MVAAFIILFLILLIIAAAYFCYRLAFSVPKQSRESLFEMPDTEQYAPYRDAARQMISEALEIPYKEVTVTSYDGLCLFGKCYFANIKIRKAKAGSVVVPDLEILIIPNCLPFKTSLNS